MMERYFEEEVQNRSKRLEEQKDRNPRRCLGLPLTLLG